jgi:hypothetical protein
MQPKSDGNSRVLRWSVVIPLVLAAAGATAQTLGSADELRQALKKELAPLSLSIKDQAKAVGAQLAEDILAQLLDRLTLGAPRPQLAHGHGEAAGSDAS